jgi:hypothetical protein
VGRTTAIAASNVRGGRRPGLRSDALQLASTVIPVSGGSMRVLEATIAIAAIATAALLGLVR